MWLWLFSVSWGGNFRFSWDVPRINKAFYNLSKQERFSGLLRGLDFIGDLRSGGFIDCSQVRYALDNLFRSELIEGINTETLCISKSLAQWDGISLFSAEEVFLIEEAAEEFKKMTK